MDRKPARIYRPFFFAVIILTVIGFVIFLSASLGILAQKSTAFGAIALKQGVSLLIGLIAFWFFSKVKYTWLKKASFFILLGAVAINLLLFVPGLTLHHGGATRWIDLGFITFQPSELLKIAFIIYLAAWIHMAGDRVTKFRFGVLPYLIIMAVLSTLLLVQSDTDTLVVIGLTGIVMLFVSGVPYRHIGLLALIIATLIASVIYFRPYALQRFKTYLNPSSDVSGASYQINQSLIAIGSGELWGRGFGQSIQKFGYLPQPTDDSIFAVAAEEFGFLGSTVLIGIYMIFAVTAFRIGTRAKDIFGSEVAIGFATLIIGESFLNIAAMLGIIPISGLPLLFVSHGGTALIIVLSACGIIANVSKHAR